MKEDVASDGITLLCCPAQPEVEIYACVGFRDDLKESWDAIREHPRMKEVVFQPLLERQGASGRVGGGRREMIETSLRNRRLFYRLCPETKRLREEIAEHLRSR